MDDSRRFVVNEREDDTIRFSLRQMFGATGFIALTLGVVFYTGRITPVIHLSMCLIGWVLWRILHCHPGGIVPILLGADILLWVSVEWVVYGYDDFLGFLTTFSELGSLLVLVGLGVLIWIGAKKQRFWRHQIVVAVVTPFILVAWWTAIPMLGNAAITRRQASDMAANNLAAANAIAMVEEVRQRTGTIPDEDNLAKLLRKPFPPIRWGDYSHPIRYQRTGDTTYELTYIDPSMLFGDTVIYDSATPKKGWFRIPF